jgi:hypothetical protein
MVWYVLLRPLRRELDGQDQVQIIVTQALNCSHKFTYCTKVHMIRPYILILYEDVFQLLFHYFQNKTKREQKRDRELSYLSLRIIKIVHVVNAINVNKCQ